MDKAFERITESEKMGNSVIINAKIQVSQIKEDLNNDIKKMEETYQEQLNALKDNLSQTQKEDIFVQQTQMNETFKVQTNALRQTFLFKKQDILLALVGKVMSSNGNSGY